MSEVIDYYALLCVTVIVKATLTYSLVLSFIALVIKYSFNKHLLTNKLLVYPARLILFTVSVMLPLDIKKLIQLGPKQWGSKGAVYLFKMSMPTPSFGTLFN